MLRAVALACCLYWIELHCLIAFQQEEFTSFIVEAGLASNDGQAMAIRPYHHVQWNDLSKHGNHIEKVTSCIMERIKPMLMVFARI